MGYSVRIYGERHHFPISSERGSVEQADLKCLNTGARNTSCCPSLRQNKWGGQIDDVGKFLDQRLRTQDQILDRTLQPYCGIGSISLSRLRQLCSMARYSLSLADFVGE